jgi:hypothetical protein
MYHFLKICIVGGGVQLGPLGTAATNRTIVPVPGDYDDGEIDGMMIGRGNRSTRRKPAPVPLCPSQTPHACPDANRGLRGGKPATNRLSYGTDLLYIPLTLTLNISIFFTHCVFTCFLKHNRTLKVAVQGLDFMAHPLYIHTNIRVSYDCRNEQRLFR